MEKEEKIQRGNLVSRIKSVGRSYTNSWKIAIGGKGTRISRRLLHSTVPIVTIVTGAVLIYGTAFGVTGDYRLGLGPEGLNEYGRVEILEENQYKEYKELEENQYKRVAKAKEYTKISEEYGYTEIEGISQLGVEFSVLGYHELTQTQEEKIAEKEHKDINLESIRLALSMNSYSLNVDQEYGVLYLYFSGSDSPFSLDYPIIFSTMAGVAIEDSSIKSLFIKTKNHGNVLLTYLGEGSLQRFRQEFKSVTTETQRETILEKYQSIMLKNGLFFDAGIPVIKEYGLLFSGEKVVKGDTKTEIYAISNSGFDIKYLKNQ